MYCPKVKKFGFASIYTAPKTNMTVEKQPFEDVSRTKHGDFPASHVSFRVFS